MTGKERISKILQARRPTGGAVEHFWGDTHKAWLSGGGHTNRRGAGCDLFGFDIAECWAFNLMADFGL